MNKSIWENIKFEAKTTRKNIETDILIIGGGITGISTSLNLLDIDKKITLIEANKLGGNITRKTTGKISILQGYNYQDIEKNSNSTNSLKYLESQIYAIKLIKHIIKKYKIKCDIKRNFSYLITNEQKNIKKIIKEKEILEQRQVKCEVINKLPNKYSCLYGIKTNISYTFNPLKYINEIKKICQNKIDFYENTRALNITKKLDYYLIKTNKNKIKAKTIIICTHYPIFAKQLCIPLKTTLEKEYIISAITDKIYSSNVLCNDDELISIRYYEDKYKYILYSSNKSLLCNKLNHKKLQHLLAYSFTTYTKIHDFSLNKNYTAKPITNVRNVVVFQKE